MREAADREAADKDKEFVEALDRLRKYESGTPLATAAPPPMYHVPLFPYMYSI